MTTTQTLVDELLRVLPPGAGVTAEDLSPEGRYRHTPFGDLGLTSMGWIDLVQRVEDTLGVALDDALLLDERRQTTAAWAAALGAVSH